MLLFFYSCNKIKGTVENTTSTTASTNNQPNIIVIVADDAGYVDFGFMGSTDLDTPEIGKLAKEGVIFTDAHVSSTVCAPSRAGLITGRYQQSFGFEANGTGYGESGDIGLSNEVTTIADVFKQNDYKTIALGKWHLGATETDHPNNRGFDEFYGFLGGGRSYFPIKNPSKELMLQYNGKREKFDGYLTDALGDFSVKFVEEHKDKPFFMYLAYNAVHTPMQAKKEDLKKYKDHPRKVLAAMTWSLDQNIGKLVNKLKSLNLFDNTVIYFISDNGGASTNTSNNGQLKGWKGNEFEGGHRVPFLMTWPKKIKANQTFKGLTSSLDIFSTSLSAANITKDSSLKLDGVDLLPFINGQKAGNPHQELYWRKLEESAARYNDFKLVKLKNYGAVLYNLSSDVRETNDLSKKDTATLHLLNSKLHNWESKMIEPLWQEEKEWMDLTYEIHKSLMQNKEVLHKEPVKISKNHK